MSDQVLDAGYVGVLDDFLDRAAGGVHQGIPNRQVRFQETSGCLNHVEIGAAGQHFFGCGFRVGKDLRGGNVSVCQRTQGLTQERMEGSRPEFDAEDAVLARQLAHETAQLHSVDPRTAPGKNELNIGMRKNLSNLGSAAGKFPFLQPEVLDPILERLRGRMA